MDEKFYQFNEYVLGYDKGESDRSALTISKMQNGNIYVMTTLTDGSADVITMMLDNLQNEIKKLNVQLNQADNKNLELIEIVNKIWNIINNDKITGIEARLMIQDLLEKEEEQ